MLAWRSQGPDDAPAIVLLHGLGETMRAWDRVLPLLGDGFRVVLVDLPGFGESPDGGRGSTIAGFADAVAPVLRDAGVRDAVVAGHSLGEFSALVANGVLSFEDALQLVSIRAMAMQKACEAKPSTMAAVLTWKRSRMGN